VLLFLGFLVLGLSNHPLGLIVGVITVALGSSFLVTLRSAMTLLVPPSSVATLYTAATVAHGVAGLVAGPVLATTFHWGMVLGEGWLGLPFLLAALLHLIALLVLSRIKKHHL